MDTMWTVVGLAVSLCVALSWAVVFLIKRTGGGRSADGRRPGHLFCGQGEAITVAELLEEAMQQGEGIRLNWPTDDMVASPIRMDELGQFPTVVLPRIEDGD